MSTVAEPKPDIDAPPADDPYYYGYRVEPILQPDGTSHFERIPLTLADHLHPQEGDHFMEGSLHDFFRAFLRYVFSSRLEHVAEALVLSDTPVYWDDPELGNHGPDVAVIFGVKRQLDEWKSFHVAKEGVRPRMIVELVTARYRKNDVVDKFREYHQARVPIYVIFDRERDSDPWTLKPYHRNPRRYVLQPLEEGGRYFVEDLNLWLAADGRKILCFDGDTGEELSDYAALQRSQRQLKTLAADETRRAESEKARADAEKIRADELQAEITRLKGQPPAP